jgi:hypothetical protein
MPLIGFWESNFSFTAQLNTRWASRTALNCVVGPHAWPSIHFVGTDAGPSQEDNRTPRKSFGGKRSIRGMSPPTDVVATIGEKCRRGVRPACCRTRGPPLQAATTRGTFFGRAACYRGPRQACAAGPPG